MRAPSWPNYFGSDHGVFANANCIQGMLRLSFDCIGGALDNIVGIVTCSEMHSWDPILITHCRGDNVHLHRHHLCGWLQHLQIVGTRD